MLQLEHIVQETVPQKTDENLDLQTNNPTWDKKIEEKETHLN